MTFYGMDASPPSPFQGTIEFMAPEVMNCKSASTRTDMWWVSCFEHFYQQQKTICGFPPPQIEKYKNDVWKIPTEKIQKKWKIPNSGPEQGTAAQLVCTGEDH